MKLMVGITQPATLLKAPLAQVLSCEFCEISKNIFYSKTRLLAASGGNVAHH